MYQLSTRVSKQVRNALNTREKQGTYDTLRPYNLNPIKTCALVCRYNPTVIKRTSPMCGYCGIIATNRCTCFYEIALERVETRELNI
jgi:hypothetical protein